MDKEYCEICEKEVKVQYRMIINGVHYFCGECGHKPKTRPKKKNSVHGIIYKCDGMGAGGVNRVN